MADRRRDTLLLIGSRLDGLYLPASGLRSASGFVPARLEPCVSCGGVMIRDDFGHVVKSRKGRGWIRDRFGRRTPCSSCGEAGLIARDPMDSSGARVGSAETTATARPRRTVRCDACDGEGVLRGERCAYCDGVGRRDLHAFELRLTGRECSACGGVGCDVCASAGDPVTDAIEARNASGSYAELDRALAFVDRRRVAVLLEAVDAGRPLDEAVEATLALVVARMPETIRVPAAVRANAKEQRAHLLRVKGRHVNGDGGPAVARRDAEIRKLIRSGRPTQWVAAEFGLSVRRVNQIVSGGEEAA